MWEGAPLYEWLKQKPLRVQSGSVSQIWSNTSSAGDPTRYTVHERSAKRNWLVRKGENGEQTGRRCTENWLQRIPKLHFYFDRDATNVNSVVFKDSKSAQKGGPKTGPWTDRFYSLIPYKDGQLLRSGKSMCQNIALKPPP